MLAKTTVFGTVSFTCFKIALSVFAPAVNPETHSASGLLLKTVDFAIEQISRPPRYTAASGTILKAFLHPLPQYDVDGE